MYLAADGILRMAVVYYRRTYLLTWSSWMNSGRALGIIASFVKYLRFNRIESTSSHESKRLGGDCRTVALVKQI